MPALVEHPGKVKPGLLLVRSAAERAEGNGMLPLLLARQLGASLLPDIVNISLGRQYIETLLAWGRWRKVEMPLRSAIIVDRAEAVPRHGAFAMATCGRIAELKPSAGPPGA
jgi:hypothetical protein